MYCRNSFGLLYASLDSIPRYAIIKKGAEAVPKDSPTLPGVVRTISHSCPQFVRIRHSSGFLEVPEEVDGQRGKTAIHGQNVPLVSKNPQSVPGLTQGLGSNGATRTGSSPARPTKSIIKLASAGFFVMCPK